MEIPMKTWSTELPLTGDNPCAEKYITPSSAFFDLETTGFSSARNQIYMIGYAYKKARKICVTQLFAENPSEEPLVISAFLEFLSGYDTLISFNGTGFDLPFLKGRCARYHFTEALDTFYHIDIYKQISGYKDILKLSALKQKTLEDFLGIPRDDTCSGGDLIPVWLEYAKQPSEEGCKLLKLHNYEDMAGMVQLLPLLSYPHFFEGGFHVSSWQQQDWNTWEGAAGKELILALEPELPIPRPFSCRAGEIYVSGAHRQVKLRAPFYMGELKYFYPNFKDYYYLPAEDMAVHKSVASFVDRAYRRQATATTCYSKKSGRFLPQYQELFSPSLKQEHQDKVSWFELTEDFTDSEENLKQYALHLLKQM